jgi:SAM-dependent methyltransferase
VTNTSVQLEVEPWEAAYLRFETPREEIRKFTRRLRKAGGDRWPRDAAIVELFCGRGNGLVALERLGFTRVTGIDLSPTLVARYRGIGRCSVGDCRALPLRSASQDVAIVQGGLHHLPRLPEDLAEVLSEVERVLKPGGVFVAVEPWLTPFLVAVHRVGRSPLVRRLWRKMDALATMIEHEGQTYQTWLQQPEMIAALLCDYFEPGIKHERLGKLLFVGEKRRPTHAREAEILPAPS